MVFDRARIKQPTMGEVLRVNKLNPLARGLVFAAIPGFNEAVTGAPGFAYGGAKLDTYKGFLCGRSASTSTDGWAWPIGKWSPFYSDLKTDITAAVLCKVDTTSTSMVLTNCGYNTSGWSYPYDATGFRRNSTGTNYGYFDVSEAGTLYGLEGFQNYIDTADAHSYMISRASNNLAWYRDGALFGSNSGTLLTHVPTLDNKCNITIMNGSSDSPVDGYIGYCWGAFWWSRALSATESAQFHINPWQVFA